MKRKIICTAMAMSVAFTMSVSTMASTINTMDVDGITRMYNEVEVVDDVVMVSASDLATNLGLSSEINYNGTAIELCDEDKETSLRMSIDNTEATYVYINEDGNKVSNTVELPVAPYILDDSFMVPLEFVCNEFDAEVIYNEDGTYSIETERTYLTNIEVREPIDEDTVIYTYDEAVAMAQENNTSLKELNGNIDDLEDTIDDLEDNKYSTVIYTTNPITGGEIGTGYNLSEDERFDVDLGIYQASESLDLLEDSEDTYKVASEAMVLNAVTNIQETLMNIQLLEKQISILEDTANNTQIMYDLDLASGNEVITANKSLSDAQDSLELINLQYASLQKSLNNILGTSITQDTVVLYEPDIETYSMTDSELDRYVSSATASNLQLKSLYNTYEYYEYAEENTPDDDDEEDYASDSGDAKRDYEDARDAYRLSVYTTYDNIEQLQVQEETLLSDLEKAKKDYSDVVVSYEAGAATAYDVEQAEMLLYNAEQALLQNALNYNLLLFTFENPDLIG